jgi:hypothetical protein
MQLFEGPALFEVRNPVERGEPDFRDLLGNGYGLEGTSPPPLAGMSNGAVGIEQEDSSRLGVVVKLRHGRPEEPPYLICQFFREVFERLVVGLGPAHDEARGGVVEIWVAVFGVEEATPAATGYAGGDCPPCEN